MSARREGKSAFDAMMDEVDSSDESDGSDADTSDEDQRQSSTSAGAGRPSVSYAAEAKSSSVPAPLSAASAAKMSKAELEIANFGASRVGGRDSFSQAKRRVSEDIADDSRAELRNWLMRPCRRDDPSIMCYIERERSSLGQTRSLFRLYLEGSKAVEKVRGRADDRELREPKFLMAARKRGHNKTSNYLLSTDADPSDDRGAASVLGKLRGDTFGQRYSIVDAGLAPDKAVTASTLRHELGFVDFHFDSGGPSEIKVWLPVVDGSAPQVWYPENSLLSAACTDMRRCVQEDRWRGRLTQLVNVKPKWDDVHLGHVLNFQGRVTESSVKNFQLCCPELPPSSSEANSDVVLQFGKAGRDRFSMDVRYPLSIYAAFAVCVACLDGKLADRKGFEFFRGIGGMGGVPAARKGAHKDEVVHVEGSMRASAGITEGLSAQYLRDKIARAFK